MREILFRGKRVDNGDWVYGVPTKDQRGETVIVESVFDCEEYDCRWHDRIYRMRTGPSINRADRSHSSKFAIK